MFFKNLGYHIREGFSSIFTHGLMSFAAVCMIVACLLIMGSFSLVAVNLNNMLSELEKENEFLAYVDESLSEDEAQALQSQIEAIPNVGTVVFVTKEEAMKEFVENRSDEGLFQDLPAEVLRDRFRIHVVDIEKMGDTVDQVRDVNGIVKTRADLEIAQGFVMVRNAAGAIALVLVVMLVVISLFIIANTIKLATFTRKEEIAIMKMCGATNWFVRWPFIFQGIFLGIFGALVAFGIQWGIYECINATVAQYGGLTMMNVLPFSTLAGNVLGAFLAAGFAIGGGGSFLAIHKFLQV